MFYTPHTLQRQLEERERDEYGRVVHRKTEWETICRCRCDDNTTVEFTSDNGHAFRPKYHVVCEGTPEISAGESLRCINAHGVVRGEGKCERVKVLNYLDYVELWM